MWRLRGPCLAVLLAIAALAGTRFGDDTRAASGTFVNEQSITITDSSSPPTRASLYPSRISVSGISGVVVDVDVTLWGFSHDDPQNSDMLLVGPGGQSVRIISDAGGDPALANLNLTIDDEASGLIPFDTATSGSYRPSNWYDSSSDSMPSPAPSGPYAETMSVFDGVDPNGDWALYIVDDSSGRSGVVAGGWSLAIATENAPALATIPNAMVDEAATLDIPIAATDADGDPLILTLVNAPAFLTLTDNGDGTGNLHAAPSYEDAGVYQSIAVGVSDGDSTSSVTFTLSVNNVNRLPVADAGADIVIADWDGDGVETVTLNGAVSSDPDNDLVAWAWHAASGSLASGATADVSFGTGIHEVTLTVTDAHGATSFDTMTVEVLDVVAPTSAYTLSSQPSEFGWHADAVTVSLTAADNTGGSGVASVSYSAWGAKSIPSTAIVGSTTSFTITANGITTVTYEARDHAGNIEAAGTLVIRIDQAAPRATAATHKYKLPLTNVTTTTLQVTMAWSGTDQVSGIQRYEIQESLNGAAYRAMVHAPLNAVTKYRMVTPGNTYQYRVRSVDFAGNASAWMTRAPFTVENYEQPSDKLSYSGAWNDGTNLETFGGTMRFTGAAGNSLTLRFKGSSVTWLAAMRTNAGKADVYLNGSKVATIDLYSRQPKNRQSLFVRNNLNPNMNHTLEIRVLGQRNVASTGTRVDIDEIIVLN